MTEAERQYDSSAIQILEGLEPDDDVVAQPSREITPGMRVAVRE